MRKNQESFVGGVSKKLAVALFAAVSMVSAVRADDQAPYELVNDPQGYSYIQINQDLDSFTFDSDFKSILKSAKIGFFTYPAGI